VKEAERPSWVKEAKIKGGHVGLTRWRERTMKGW